MISKTLYRPSRVRLTQHYLILKTNMGNNLQKEPGTTMNHIRNVIVHPLSQLLTLGSAILFSSDARAQLPLRLVPRPQNMQNGQKLALLLGLCPNHIFCS